MAAFTAVEISQMRRWTGSTPDVGLLEAEWRLHGESEERAALSLLRQRRADLVSLSPGKWAVAGDYSQEYTGDQLKALDADIDTLARLCGDPAATSGYSTAYLVRDGAGR